jgi:3-oxoacyl-[acyl-carrier protein] reductase
MAAQLASMTGRRKERTTELFLSGKSDGQIEQLRKGPPLQRLGEPEHIDSVVSFLAGPNGSWVNARVLRANGGFA